MLYVIRSDPFCGGVVLGFKQSLDTSLHQLFMVFVTHVVWCEPVFQTVSNHVAFFHRLERPWIAVSAFGPSLFVRKFAIG